MKARHAELYRMVTPEHICPFGVKSRGLLKRYRIPFEDHPLQSRAETEAFMREAGVSTTPQTYIDGIRTGGYDDLRRYFGLEPEGQKGTSYTPVTAIFATALLMAAALAWGTGNTAISLTVLKSFVAISMCILAIQKLRDLTSFTNQFIAYDLLSMRLPRYAYVYPFLEAWVGIGMLASLPAWLVSPVALCIGGEGAVSVFKAVYIDKRELKCACAGGDSRVPLGFVSLTENVFMIVAGVWMWIV